MLVYHYKDHNIRSGVMRVVAIKLADRFMLDNPKFNKDKFLTACGITSKE